MFDTTVRIAEAFLAGSIAAARWGEFATGPALARQDVLVPLLIVLASPWSRTWWCSPGGRRGPR